MQTVMARSAQDEQQMLHEADEVTPLMPTQIFFKEEPISIHVDEITPLTPLQVFPKTEPMSIHVDEITPLTPLQVFPKSEPVPCEEDEMTVLTPLEVFPKEELILGGVDDITPLAPLQVFPKEEPISDQLCEVQPLPPVQVFIKGEPEDTLSDASSEDSRSLVINLDNSSDAETNDCEPVIIGENVHPYISDYTDRSDNLLISVEDPTRIEPDPLRLSDDTTQITLDSEEPIPTLNDSGDSMSSVSSPDSHRPELYQCMLCRKSFCSAIDLQMHKQTHHMGNAPTPKHLFDKLLKQLMPIRPPKAQHRCSNCGMSFSQLQLLMRHRLAHLNTALHKPFSSLQAEATVVDETAAGTSAVPRRAVRVAPASSHKRRIQKKATREQLTTTSVRHLRTRIRDRMLS